MGIEVSTGTTKWETPLGYLPWLKHRVEARQWGLFGRLGGAILTASGLAFVANTLDGHLRAFDVSNGTQLWGARPSSAGTCNADDVSDASPAAIYVWGHFWGR